MNPAAVPATGTNLTIADTTTNGLTLDGTTSRGIGGLTFGTTGTRTAAFTLNSQAGNTLTINGGVSANGAFSTTSTTSLTMRGHIIVDADQTWSVAGSAAHNTDQGIFVREVATGATNRGSLALNANLTKSGVGQLLLAAIDVTGPGNVIVDGGSFKLNAGASQPLVVGGTGNITLNNSSVLSVYKNTGTMNITRPIVMNGTSALATRANTCDIASTITFNGTHTLDSTVTANLTGSWSGAGTVNRVGGGTMNVSSASGFTGTLNLGVGVMNITGALGGSLGSSGGTNSIGGGVPGNVSSTGGSTTVNGPVGGNVSISGNGTTAIAGAVTGDVTVSGGTLNLGGASVGGLLNLGAGGTLGGEPTVAGYLDLGGGAIAVNPVTAGSPGTASDLTLTGINTVTLTANPVSTAPFTVLSYGGTLSGGVANLSLSGGATNYRSPTFSDTTPGIITLAVSSEARTWNAGAYWDVNTSAAWVEGDRKFLQLDAVTFTDAGVGTNGTVLMVGTLIPSSIAVTNSIDYTFSSGTGGILAGAGTLTKNGTGVLNLGGANTFTGDITINGGTVKPVVSQSLGANGKTITVNAGGSLDTNGVLGASRDYNTVIAGTGVGDTGAITNSTTTGNQVGFRSITLSDDASIGGSGRWDVRPIVAGAALVDLNGKTLTKTGANTIAIVDGTMPNAGSIHVTQGTLAITRMTVAGSGTVSVDNFAALKFENNTSGSFSKSLAVDGATVQTTGNAFIVAPGVTVANTATFLCEVNLTINGTVSGDGLLTKTGAGALVLAGDATHTGGTTVSTGTLQIGNGGATGNLAGPVLNYGTVAFNRPDACTYPGVISGTGAFVNNGSGTLTLTGAVALNAGTASLPTPDASGANFVFTFTRREESANDTTQVFQYSSDLAGWTPVNITAPTGAEVSLGTPSGGLQTITVTIPKSVAPGGKLFGRLRTSSL